MKEVEVTITHPVGLHARPAAVFVQTAKKFVSDIKVSCCDNTKNAKSILGVLGLCAGQNARITIQATGADEEDAVKALVELIESNFGE